jgi:GT2 family glycosyltransferase
MRQNTNVASQSQASVVARETTMPDVSIVIVNYNVREFLQQALRSIERATDGLNVEVFVVDNDSVDGSVEMVRSQFPDVRVIANKRNVGFSKANNQAIRMAHGRYIFVLNPDTIIQEDTLTTLVRFMDEHPEAGAVGCKILNPDGSFALESRRSFPTPEVAFYRFTGLSRLFPRSRRFGRYNLTYLPQNEVAEVDALSGSCMMVRRAALYFSYDETAALLAQGKDPNVIVERRRGKVKGHGAGLFDEDFFMYGEDLDWCFRFQKSGWKNYYTPETQIIHYKGESTKKGELRYVKLFYGAMLHFTEKHFQSRYSRWFARGLRLAIIGRAGLTVAGNVYRRLRMAILDFLLIYLIAALLVLGRSVQAGASPSVLFFLTVAPAFGLGSVLAIAGLGGYRYKLRYHVRPVFSGVSLGFLLVAALSFFVKDVAFSRAVVLLSYPLSLLVLSGYRFIVRSRKKGTGRAILVGSVAEARRLEEMLKTHPSPPFELLGYTTPEAHPASTDGQAPALLGTAHQLRDIVRLHDVDDVVFSASGLSNQLIFRIIQQLRDLPVQFRMLTEGRSYVIGKASVEDLSLPSLIEVDESIAKVRSKGARRIFEFALSVGGLMLHPFIWTFARITRHDGLARLSSFTGKLPMVLSGRRALVGYHDDDGLELPASWELRPGIFAITDAFPVRDLSPQEARRVYWFYVRNQSSALDGEIILRTVRNLLR